MTEQLTKERFEYRMRNTHKLPASFKLISNQSPLQWQPLRLFIPSYYILEKLPDSRYRVYLCRLNAGAN